MNRRTFLVAGASSALGGALAVISACSGGGNVTPSSTIAGGDRPLLSGVSFEVHRDPG